MLLPNKELSNTGLRPFVSDQGPTNMHINMLINVPIRLLVMPIMFACGWTNFSKSVVFVFACLEPNKAHSDSLYPSVT